MWTVGDDVVVETALMLVMPLADKYLGGDRVDRLALDGLYTIVDGLMYEHLLTESGKVSVRQVGVYPDARFRFRAKVAEVTRKIARAKGGSDAVTASAL